jgi:hypothetical protein
MLMDDVTYISVEVEGSKMSISKVWNYSMRKLNVFSPKFLNFFCSLLYFLNLRYYFVIIIYIITLKRQYS